MDNENGGFYGAISNDHVISKQEPKGVILCARILWTFSSAYRVYKDEMYLRIADHALKYLLEYFYDKKHGGVFMLLDYNGKPLDDRKFLYAQAFAIYGLAEYYRSTNNEKALEMALELFCIVEKHCLDLEHGGYYETFSREWTEPDNYMLGEKHLNVCKSMNAHLHLMEAYTNLYRVFKIEQIEKRLRALIEISLKHIIHPETYHLNGFFGETWDVKSDSFTYGQDIETSWLLFEAVEVLGDEELLKKCMQTAINMAKVTLEQGVAEDGSIYYEANAKGVFDLDRVWWCQIEAVVGFVNAYQLTNELKYLKAAENCWNYIEGNIIDKVHGEWFWGRNPDGTIIDKEKMGSWKCPYHNGRGCMEMLERYKNLC